MSVSKAVTDAADREVVSHSVVSAVAEVTDTRPESLEPLYHTVDPDALNALFDGDRTGFGRSPLRVEFTYCGCDVVVFGDGSVHVEESKPGGSSG